MQLEAEGFKVLHAASAEAALVLAVQQPLSLITLDIMLPNMDGWEFLSRLKQVPELCAHPGGDHLDRGRPRTRASRSAPRRSCRSRSPGRSCTSRSSSSGSSRSRGASTLKVLVVDDDPKAVELIAVRILGLAEHRAARVRRPRGDRARAAGTAGPDRARPDDAGRERLRRGAGAPANARTRLAFRSSSSRPRRSPPEDRAKLNGYVTTIMEKAEFDRERFWLEVRRAMSGRAAGRLTWPPSWSSKTTPPT